MLGIERLEERWNPASIPTATIPIIPNEVLIGESFALTTRFDNTSSTDTGFGPYIDLYFPATGIDGRVGPPNDGITFQSATFMGINVNAQIITLTAAGVDHPFARDINGNPVKITPPSGFFPGDQLVVLELPYGSVTPTQPAIDIQVTANVSPLADNNAPLSIAARGGFRFGNDSLNNPSEDPIIIGPLTTDDVTPTVIKLSKIYVGTEDETATGPNFPRQYRIQLDIANGQTLTNINLTDVLPEELQFLRVDFTLANGNPTTTTLINTPSLTIPGGILTRQFSSVTGTSSAIDAEMIFSFYAPLNNTSGSPVLDPVTGNDQVTTDDASASAMWTPLDPRDQPTTVTSDIIPIDHTLSDCPIRGFFHNIW